MNILDENVIENQCQLLRSWRIQFRQIGYPIVINIIGLTHIRPYRTFRGSTEGKKYNLNEQL